MKPYLQISFHTNFETLAGYVFGLRLRLRMLIVYNSISQKSNAPNFPHIISIVSTLKHTPKNDFF